MITVCILYSLLPGKVQNMDGELTSCPTVHDLHNTQLHKITIRFTLLDHNASQMHSRCVTQWQSEESATKSLVTGREELLRFLFVFVFFFCGWIQNCYARLSALGKRMSGACSTNKLCEQHTSTWPEFDLVVSRSAVAQIGSFHSAPSSARVAQAFAVRCRTRLREWLSRVSHVLPRCASEKSPSWLSPGIRPRLLIRLISARTTHSVRLN